MRTLFCKYMISTATYGVLRSIPWLYNMEEEYYNRQSRETQTRPMLLTEKVVCAALNGVTAPVAWPFYLYTDARVAEIKLTNKDPRHYRLESFCWGRDV
jgi:hypothetical protein